MNLREALQEIQAQFDHESHQYPGLRHFWLQAVQFVPTSVLEHMAQLYGQPLAEVTRWPGENERIDFSCFAGSGDQVECFKRLAYQARSLFVQLGEQLGGNPRHARYNPPIAWLADLYFQANSEPKPHLGVDRFALGEWPTAVGTNKLLRLPFGEQFEVHLHELRTEFGEPVASYRIQGLVQDVFTASTAMIANIFEEGLADLRVGTALDVSARELPASTSCSDSPPHSDSQPATAGTDAATARSSASFPARPGWVNQAELIGPCGHTAFARLMNISDRQLYRLIETEQVWKEPGPSAKKFYFYHHDHPTHRRLQNAFEQSRSQKR